MISFSLYIKIYISSAAVYKYISSFIPTFIGHVIRWSLIMFLDMRRCDTIDTMSICSKEGEKTEIQFNILKSGFHLPKVLIYFNKSLKKRQKMLLILCSFRYWDFYIFVQTFRLWNKTDKKAIQNFWCHRLDNK